MGIVEVSTPTVTGRVSDHAAHVLSWQPAGHRPVIWMSSEAIFAPGVAIRGGVPICFPWFGAGRSGALSPAHGFARLVEWPNAEVLDEGGVTSITHELTDALATSPEFPFHYRALARVEFGSVLRMSLTVENTDVVTFSFEEALHTYLAVGDATAVSIFGLEGAGYHDKVLDQQLVQAGPVSIEGEVDRVYSSTASVTVADPVLDRTITVVKEGSASTIVWNPWVDKARALRDFGDDEWRSMVCVETANVGDDAVTLVPGQVHTMSVEIRVGALQAP